MDVQKILSKISEYTSLRPKENAIGIDSLALILRISEPLLFEILKQLEEDGKIEITDSPANSRRRTRSGSVRCITCN